jgi:hypothetical protein
MEGDRRKNKWETARDGSEVATAGKERLEREGRRQRHRILSDDDPIRDLFLEMRFGIFLFPCSMPFLMPARCDLVGDSVSLGLGWRGFFLVGLARVI